MSLFTEPMAETLGHIEAFLSGLHTPTEFDRALAAILFTDIVGSTERASALGDHAWRNLLESHDVSRRTVIEQHQGTAREDDGRRHARHLRRPRSGHSVRPWLSATPCDHSALRSALASTPERWRCDRPTSRESPCTSLPESSTLPVRGTSWYPRAVPMLVAGSGIEFEDRGEHELKGVQGTWRLYAVEG